MTVTGLTSRRLVLLAATTAILTIGFVPPPADARSAAAPDPSRFSTTVDNPFFPLTPGTVLRYRETRAAGGGTKVVTVTHRTKVIQGVETVVVRDRAFVGGALVEDTRDWYAQDDKGNVWYFGENTKEIDNGKVVSTEGSWKAGQDGARAGILMKARPRVGQTYYQEFRPGVAEGQATVLSLDASGTVPYGSFDNALKTKDFSALHPDTVERKFYVRGVGCVLEKLVKGGKDRMALVSVEQP